MKMLLSTSDFALLSPSTQDELLSLWKGAVQVAMPEPAEPKAPDHADQFKLGEEYNGFHMEIAADLTPSQMRTWMQAASDTTKAGLRLVAERGPIINAVELKDAGITNIPHFQSRTTIRTRTITGNKDIHFFGWDDWEWNDDRSIKSGRYAVTPITFHSLRKYFGLD